MKYLFTPIIIWLATTLSRKLGTSIGGWVIALPLTSAPAAYLLAQNEGFRFTEKATLGMLAGTASQVAFAIAYAITAKRYGKNYSLISGTIFFAIATAILRAFKLSAMGALLIVLISIALGIYFFNKAEPTESNSGQVIPTWDLPVRMATATIVVIAVTESAPLIGAHMAGLLSPFPILGATLAYFEHSQSGAKSAIASFRGLVIGLITPAIFFYILTTRIQHNEYAAFVYAAIAAATFQILTGRFLIQKKA